MNEIYRWKRHFQQRSKKPSAKRVITHSAFLEELRESFKNFGIVSEEKDPTSNKSLVRMDQEPSTSTVTELQTRLQAHLDWIMKIKAKVPYLDAEASRTSMSLAEDEQEVLTKIITFVSGVSCQAEPTIRGLREILLREITPLREFLEDFELPAILDGAVDSDKLATFCKKLGVFIQDNDVALILFEDHLWEIDLEQGTVYLKSRQEEERVAFVCLQWDYTTQFQGFSTMFTPRELLILSKIVAILTNSLPKEVKTSVEAFLREGKGAAHVFPIQAFGQPIGHPARSSIRANLISELREVFRQRGLSTKG